jgi:hypothetical protein
MGLYPTFSARSVQSTGMGSMVWFVLFVLEFLAALLWLSLFSFALF